MDIKINAKGHPNQVRLTEFYTTKLRDKLGVFKFITIVKAHIEKTQSNQFKVGLNVIPEKGQVMFAESEDASENLAFNQSIQKIKRQLDKYKEIHYGSSHKNHIDL